jgi:hypothetical protein
MRRKSLQLLLMLPAFWLPAPSWVAYAAPGDTPPRFEVSAPAAATPLVFVVYGDTRFTERNEVVNAVARRALVGQIARENPAAILIGGDLVYEGSHPVDYDTYKGETLVWSERKFPIFPVLGNHEFKGCPDDVTRCLENWWNSAAPPSVRPFRWYSVSIGPTLLALMLDSDAALKPGSEQREWFERQIAGADERVKFILIVLHYPPVRDPFYPSAKDENEIARYLSKKAASLHARVVVVASHIHNYERYYRNGVTYVVSGGGGAKPVPAFRLFGEKSKLKTSVNFHYLRFTLTEDRLTGTMVRFDAEGKASDPWSEPDHFEVRARN